MQLYYRNLCVVTSFRFAKFTMKLALPHFDHATSTPADAPNADGGLSPLIQLTNFELHLT